MSEKKENKEKKGGFGFGKHKPPKFNAYWIYGLIALGFLAIQFIDVGNKPEEITRNRFKKEMLLKGDVAKIVIINREIAEVYIKESKLDTEKYNYLFEKSLSSNSKSGPHYYFTIGSVDTFEDLMREAQKEYPDSKSIDFSYKTRKDYFAEILGWLFPIIILVAVWLFIFRRMGAAGGGGSGNIFNIGKSKAKIFDKESMQIKINFQDVAGLEEAKVFLYVRLRLC